MHPSHAGRPIPPAAAVILDAAASNADVVSRLWRVLTDSIAALENGLKDPKVRLGDIAKATDVLLRSHQLLAGRATENIATNISITAAFSDEERAAIAFALDAELKHRELMNALDSGMSAAYDAEIHAVTMRYTAMLASGRYVPFASGDVIEPRALGPGDPLSPDELVQLAQWAQSKGVEL
jgi:hypothetical protein